MKIELSKCRESLVQLTVCADKAKPLTFWVHSINQISESETAIVTKNFLVIITYCLNLLLINGNKHYRVFNPVRYSLIIPWLRYKFRDIKFRRSNHKRFVITIVSNASEGADKKIERLDNVNYRRGRCFLKLKTTSL